MHILRSFLFQQEAYVEYLDGDQFAEMLYEGDEEGLRLNAWPAILELATTYPLYNSVHIAEVYSAIFYHCSHYSMFLIT